MGEIMRKGTIIFVVAIFAIAMLASSVFAQANLGGERWQLTELNGKRMSNSRIYVEFDEGQMRVSGHAGCNRFFGGYELEGQSFTVAGVGSTKMACMRPGSMETEREFLKALGSATRLRKNGTNLNLFAAKTRTMRFRAMPKEPEVGVGDLTAMKWMLKSIGNTPVALSKDAPFLNFDAEKKSAGGNTGCNVFGGNYATEGSTIRFSQMISTMRACEFEDRMTIERGFLDGLQNADRYEIAGTKLKIFKGSELLLEFEGTAK